MWPGHRLQARKPCGKYPSPFLWGFAAAWEGGLVQLVLHARMVLNRSEVNVHDRLCLRGSENPQSPSGTAWPRHPVSVAGATSRVGGPGSQATSTQGAHREYQGEC